MLPVGLSKSLKNELKGIKNFPDLVSKLNENPLNLINFLGSALQSKVWFAKNSHSIVLITVKISDNILSGRLPFNDAISRCMAIFKYHLSFADSMAISDFIVNDIKIADLFVSRIVLMNASPVLRDKFTQSPGLKTLPLSSFSPHLNRTELAGLYKAFLTGDILGLQIFDFPALLRILFQCFDWKTPHVKEVERLVVSRVSEFSAATGGLALSKYRNLDLLEASCRSFLEQLTFCLSVDMEKGIITYSCYDAFISEPGVLDLFTYLELYAMNSKVRTESIEANIKIKLNHIWIAFQDKERVVVGYYRILSDTGHIQKNRQENPQVKLKVDSIQEVMSSEINKIPDTCLIGLLIYFRNVTRFKMLGYTSIDPIFFEYMALKTNLKSLGFIDFRGSFDKLLPLVTRKIPQLQTLVVQKGSIKGEALRNMMAQGSLNEIKLADCLIEYGDFSFFSSLKSLSLLCLPSSNAMIQDILSTCQELECLEIGDLYPYGYQLPVKLRKLGICTKMLQAFVKEGSIPVLDTLPQLKELIIVGPLSQALEEVLSKYMPKYHVQFEKSFII